MNAVRSWLNALSMSEFMLVYLPCALLVFVLVVGAFSFYYGDTIGAKSRADIKTVGVARFLRDVLGTSALIISVCVALLLAVGLYFGAAIYLTRSVGLRGDDAALATVGTPVLIYFGLIIWSCRNNP